MIHNPTVPSPADRVALIRSRVGTSELPADVAALLTQISTLPELPPEPAPLRDFAERYTAAWCSHDAASVAAFSAPDGSLRDNNGPPAIGRDAITAATQGFMTAFPDMTLLLDDVFSQAGRTFYCWTLIGTNTGPGGTGSKVRLGGFEVWRIGADGLIVDSLGYFDTADYQHQLKLGALDAKS